MPGRCRLQWVSNPIGFEIEIYILFRSAKAIFHDFAAVLCVFSNIKETKDWPVKYALRPER